MKALTLHQPWASLIALGVKTIETRSWATSYRGPIAIHAAKRIDVAGAPDELCASALGVFWPSSVPIGAVVAIGRLVDVSYADQVPEEELTAADREAGNFTRGRYAWRLTDIRPLRKPIPLTGRQGLFNWTPPANLAANLLLGVDHRAECHRIGWAA